MEVKPYTDEEIASVREAMRKRAVSACTPDHSRWLATLDEARAEVARLEAANAVARFEIARLRAGFQRVRYLCGNVMTPETLTEIQAEVREALAATETTNEDPSEVARLRELDEQRVELIRESMERGSEIARLRERVREGEGLLREIQGSAASFDEMNSYEREDFATDEWMERMEELLRERNALHDSIDTYLAAADTTKEGGDAESPNARAASGSAGSGERARPSPPASPSPSSASGREAGLAAYDALTSREKNTIIAQDPRYCYARGWQASRAALPTVDALLDKIDPLESTYCGEWDNTEEIASGVCRYTVERVLALIGGDDE